jgi:hypothetical protein
VSGNDEGLGCHQARAHTVAHPNFAFGAPDAFAADTIQSQVTAIPAGMRTEVRLNNKQKMRGALGPIDNAGFTLVDSHTGDRQIAFTDVASVKRFNAKSHLRRNILIATVIGVAAVGITAGVLLRGGPFGCGSHPGL